MLCRRQLVLAQYIVFKENGLVMKFIDKMFMKLGYVKKSDIQNKLNFARSIAKRLDEHREIVEAIEQKTSLFKDFWHIEHLATQDDYLMRLFFMVHGFWPESRKKGVFFVEKVRSRPRILGSCRLPEYEVEDSGS